MLLLQLLWYYSTSWVSIIGDLVLVLIFKFRILKYGWFWMLGIIASNFLKIGNGWATVEKYAPTVVLVGAHVFPQFLGNFRSHSNASSTSIFSKKTRIYWIGKGLTIPRKICLISPMAIRITRSVIVKLK